MKFEQLSQTVEGMIPDWFKQFVAVGNDLIWSEFLIGLLILAGLYFTFSSNFVQIKWLKQMFDVLGDKAELLPNGKKGISSFQAFAISAAARVGTGNIAGVATAIVLGGPGAVFWMWVIAFFGAATAFYEATLAQVYKVKDADGGFRGGPAYYMQLGLNQRWMGVLFAILISVTFAFVFNTVQSNTIAVAFEESFGVNRLLSGVIIAIISGIVIFGGVRSIAKVTQMIVPIMAIIYIIVVFIILVINYDQVIPMIMKIFNNAFGIKEVFGGAVGMALLNGIKRGLFSNEAGMGSAPNAAATAAVSHPVKQGLIQSLGVYFDTMLVCTSTAIMILLYTDLEYGEGAIQGIQVTQQAMDAQLGGFGPYFIAVAITLFAFSSILGNYYYGQSNIEFITENKIVMLLFRVLVVCMIIIGSVLEVATVWSTADLFMGLMAILNIVAIIGLAHVVNQVAKDYIIQRKQGIDPIFKTDKVKADLTNVSSWGEHRYQEIKSHKAEMNEDNGH
ncbi:alanine/glycine:cation symporter family protein [Abyssicoccus albus]|uniref:AGCS family alanine or glycine:cation symporter n=1 Tax=Abyssicoccus albus TaxID=1817405 RepID=A0A3N5BJB0_9BACL|nr:alanine/glycine:cation symporter family protein [Abyssicoccus albus]RPF57946.1 AGCS family alanine or glycine:cation symporter [Abyssicoccus albus]